MFKNILIVKLSSLGDIIHTLPAFKAIRENFPESKICWISEKSGNEILKYVDGIDEIVIFDTLNWRKKPFSMKTLRELKESLGKIRKKFDLAIDFQGTLKSSLITFFSLAKERIGFEWKNLREPISTIFYTKRGKFIPENTHVILKNLKLLETIGIKKDFPEFPNFRIDASLPDEIKVDKERLILINGGGGWETKLWVKGRWRELALRLKALGYEPLFLWGNNKERERMEEESKGDIPLSPFLTIPQVIKLISFSRLLISGDTFPLHMANALGVPVIGIFGPSSPWRNGPISKNSRVVFKELDCSFCYKRKCKKMECMKRIDVESVMDKVKELL
jgi:lipopolysaccharide heptosyltransferase I